MNDLKSEPVPGNKLLAALTRKDRDRILQKVEQVDLQFGEVLFRPGDKVHHVYFPMSGLISLLTVEEGATLEMGMIGNEGMIGLPAFLETPFSRSLIIVQGSGTALRMKVTDFRRECEQNALLSRLMRRYTFYLLHQISQSVLCARRHQVEERLACMLLMMQDRTGAGQFQLKQELLANLLGVRREAVTVAAGNLQQQQLISYSRGNLRIVDREGLEGVCCRCYQAVNDEYVALVEAAGKRFR